jgi:hypothetical protein
VGLHPLKVFAVLPPSAAYTDSLSRNSFPLSEDGFGDPEMGQDYGILFLVGLALEGLTNVSPYKRMVPLPACATTESDTMGLKRVILSRRAVRASFEADVPDNVEDMIYAATLCELSASRGGCDGRTLVRITIHERKYDTNMGVLTLPTRDRVGRVVGTGCSMRSTLGNIGGF